MNNEYQYMLDVSEPVNTHSISIEDSYWNLAKQLGRGNASRGIRFALYKATISNGNTPFCATNSKEVDGR